MAFVRNPLKDDGDQSSGVIGTDGQQITGDQGAKPVSNWTNLNNYIDGNQGVGAGLADTMLADGNADTTAANNANTSFSTAAITEADSKTKKVDGWDNYFTNDDLSNASPEKKAAYRAWKSSASYGGPADAANATGYSDYLKAQGKAQDSVARSATQDAQFGLAKDSIGKGNQNYNSGMGMLDTILTRQTGGGDKIDAFQAANGVVDGKSQVGERSKTAIKGVNDHIGGAKARGDAAQLTAQTALNTRLTGLAGDISGRETTKMGSGDGAYVEDHSRADYASDAEIAALNSMVNDFGGEGVDSDNLNDLTTKSNKSNETVGERRERLAMEERIRRGVEEKLKEDLKGATLPGYT